MPAVRASGSLVAAGLLIVACVTPAHGSGVANTASSTWVTDNHVYDAVAAGDLVYLAGSFTRIGPRTGPLTFLDPVTGEPMPGSAMVTGGGIVTMTPDGAGGYVIAGDFTAVNGVARRGLARLTAAGALDAAFAPAVVDTVLSIAVAGSWVYVGGYWTSPFTEVLVALDLATGATLPWTPAFGAAPTHMFVLPNGHLVAGRRAVATNYGAEYDPVSGALLAEWPTVPWVTLDANTVVTAVGYTIRRYDVATRIGTDVATAAPVSCGRLVFTCRGLTGMTLRQQTLYIAGDFVTAAGGARAGAAAIDVNTGALLPWQVPGVSGRQPWHVFAGGGRILVHYADSLTFGLGAALVAVDPVTGSALGWAGHVLGGVVSAAIDEGGPVVVAGGFEGAGGVERGGLAAVRWPDGAPTAWTAQAGLPPGVPRRLARAGTRLFVWMESFQASSLRELDFASGIVAPWSPSLSGDVWALRVRGTRLFVAGSFTAVDGVRRTHVASFDVATTPPTLEAWAPIVESPGSFADVTGLDAAGGVVVMSGGFTAVGGEQRWGLAAVDGQSGAPLPWAPRLRPEPGGGTLYFVEVAGSRVWVSGLITSANGAARTAIAAFDFGGQLTSWSPGQPIYPYSLNGYEQHAWFFEDHLYVGKGYSVEASDGTLTLWTPDLVGNLLGGAWVAAEGRGLVLYDTVRGGFFLYPRVEGPGPVSNLAASVLGNSVTLGWQGPSDAVTYVVEAGSASGLTDLARIDTHSTATSFAATGPDGRFVVRVRAKSLGGLGLPSTERTIVLGPGACAAPPVAPTSVRGDTAGPRVRLDWSAPPGSIETFVVEASFDGGLAFVGVVGVPGNITSFEGVGPPGQYLVRVRADNQCGAGEASAAVPVVLTAVTVPPLAPNPLTATVGPGRTVALTWPAVAGLPTGYRLDVGSAPGESNLGSFFVSGAPVVTAGVPPGVYFVRVRAVNVGGVGPPSNDLTVAVP